MGVDIMKIVFISDLENYNLSKLIINVKKIKDIDLIITIGDLAPSIIKRLDKEFCNTVKLGVLGNHDNYFDFDNSQFINIDNRIYHYNGFSFVGNEGCLPYNDDTNVFKTNVLVKKGLKPLIQTKPFDFLISHNSPLGIHDNAIDIAHKGYDYLRELIYYENVSFIFHGHQHINKLSKVKNTLVVGIYGCVLFNTETLTFHNISYQM